MFNVLRFNTIYSDTRLTGWFDSWYRQGGQSGYNGRSTPGECVSQSISF